MSSDMESPPRGALALVRLVAACLIVLAMLDAGIYFTAYLIPYLELRHHLQPQTSPSRLNFLRLAVDAIPAIAGLIMLFKARAIAEWLSNLIE